MTNYLFLGLCVITGLLFLNSLDELILESKIKTSKAKSKNYFRELKVFKLNCKYFGFIYPDYIFSEYLKY